MAVWFLRVSTAICFTMGAGALSLAGLDWYRDSSYETSLAESKQLVADFGGDFSEDPSYATFIVELEGSRVTDADLERLAALLQQVAKDSQHSSGVKRMFAFDLSGTRVGNRGLRAIAALQLDWLNLNGTQVSNEGLAHLRQQRRLGVVTLFGTHVTPRGVNEMRRSMPHVWVPMPPLLTSAERSPE